MTFKEYYQYYLSLHQNRWCRRLHVLGQAATLLYIAVVCYKQLWMLLLFAPFIVYPFAWSGHFVFEKNQPAAFTRPLWAKVCDWLMMKDLITGKIEW